MKNKLNYFIQKSISIGVVEVNSQEFNDRLRIMNIFVWICILFCTPYYIFMASQGYYSLALLFVFVQILFSISLISSHYTYYNTAKILILLTTNFSTLILTITFGYGAGFYLYYFSSPLIVFSLFHFKQLKFILIGWSFYLLSFLVSELIHFYELKSIFNVSPSTVESVYILNTALVLVFILMLSFGFSKYHFQTYRILRKKNSELEINKIKLERLIKEKNILLSETHHRVKNNLAVISGLFDLQLMFNDDPQLSSLMNNSKTRIKSMSLVHESLYEQDDLSKIEFNLYLERIVHEIEKSHNTNPNVIVKMDVGNLFFDLEKAIPLGLIINEILTNAFKHAFQPQQEGIIRISFNQSENYSLIITDNGKGMPTDKFPAFSMGMTLIDALVKQLNGEYEFRNEQGTIFEVKFS